MNFGAIFLIYLVTGCAAGYLAGLLGVGGGVLIVPVLLFLFERFGFPRNVFMQLAIGTSMATVSVTAVSSARAHHANGNVDWQRFRSLAPAVLSGVIIGALVGASISRRLLMVSVCAFEVGVAVLFVAQVARGKRVDDDTPRHSFPAEGAQFGISALLGATSSLVGIAGGTLFVPYLNFVGMGMRRAIGTAAALGVPVGVVAALVYLAAGLAKGHGLPTYAVGYVYVPAFLGCVLGSVSTTRHGATLGKRMNVRGLKLAFAFVLLVAAAKMSMALRTG